jgi:hypothetical protein
MADKLLTDEEIEALAEAAMDKMFPLPEHLHGVFGRKDISIRLV